MADKVYNDLLNHLTVRYEGTYMYSLIIMKYKRYAETDDTGKSVTDFPANPWLHAISMSSQPHTQLQKYDYMLSLKPAGHVQLALYIL